MKVVIKAVSYRLKSVNRFSYTVIETIKTFNCQQKERKLGPKRTKKSNKILRESGITAVKNKNHSLRSFKSFLRLLLMLIGTFSIVIVENGTNNNLKYNKICKKFKNIYVIL